jgi:FKBP-type peptidyl-prolyl cis-trans isomerase 2
LKKHSSRRRSTRDVDLELAPADAYGEKDSTQIETISIDKLRRAVRDPNALYLGAPVNIGGRQGYLSFLAAGRARIDYNHPMAGKTLKYNFKIVKVVEGKEEKRQHSLNPTPVILTLVSHSTVTISTSSSRKQCFSIPTQR